MDQDRETSEVSASLRKVLNTHGHSFQFAVLRRAERLSTDRRSLWLFDGAEFPVVAGGDTTHIDFVLRSRSRRTFLVAECKRADPAKARWCFARAPYTWRDPSPKQVIFDQFLCRPANVLVPRAAVGYSDRGVYQIGFELRTGNQGEGTTAGSAINQAIAQVLRGTAGLINHLFEFSRRSFSQDTTARFLPVIFTTAQLWVTESDLAAAEVETGNLPGDAVKATQVDWLWFTHNRSASLRHDLEWEGVSDDLTDELKREFARSVAIVSPKGIDAFLAQDLEQWLE